MHSASGVRVQYLKVWEKSSYKVGRGNRACRQQRLFDGLLGWLCAVLLHGSPLHQQQT
jgi:hypothetical protein